MWPGSDGQPTVMPATGMTRCGSLSISLTFAEWSRITLIGQVPKPDRVGGAQERRQHDAGIDRGVEELIEMIVRKRLAAHLGDFRQPPAVRQEHQERRRGADERLVRDEIGDRPPDRLCSRSRCRPAAGRSCSAPTARRRTGAAAARDRPRAPWCAAARGGRRGGPARRGRRDCHRPPAFRRTAGSGIRGSTARISDRPCSFPCSKRPP